MAQKAKCKCDLKTCYKTISLSVQFYCLWFA